MGYYDKERVRGFLHNQDGIIVNDFGEGDSPRLGHGKLG